ncbi:hypothetical protein [Citrobacter sp.]|uniref:hypothetical protein n=1 Tax=Citrobacter sp. TaxID=1896336 RepID=UPI002FC74FCD
MAPKTKDEEVKGTAVATSNQNAVAMEFMDMGDFGGGFEGTDAESFAIPFLQLLQKMSPLVDEDSPRHIEGLKAGMFYNTVTGQSWEGKEKGLLIIPCAYKRSFIKWGGREGADGGFLGEMSVQEFEALQADPTKVAVVEGRYYEPDADGHVNEKKSSYFADTRSHFVMIIDEETGEFGTAIMSLASSQIKASKMLMTALNQKKVQTPQGLKTPPTYANIVRIKSQGMSNEKGSWSGIKFELEGLVTDANLYQNAKAFYQDIVKGNVNVDYTKADAASTSGQDDVSDKPKDAEGF